jgi:hypothetical protein
MTMQTTTSGSLDVVEFGFVTAINTDGISAAQTQIDDDEFGDFSDAAAVFKTTSSGPVAPSSKSRDHSTII